MNKELEIWQFAAEKLKRNESVMLLVVAESSGSSPGRQGFKMIVAKSEMCGSVGGGVMEVKLVEQAKSQIPSFKSKIIEQVHRRNSPAASGMICSGRQTIILFQFDSSHLKIVRAIVSAIKNGQPKILRISSLNKATKIIFSIGKNSDSKTNFTSSAADTALWLYRR